MLLALRGVFTSWVVFISVSVAHASSSIDVDLLATGAAFLEGTWTLEQSGSVAFFLCGVVMLTDQF
jgi:hypothetical protein